MHLSLSSLKVIFALCLPLFANKGFCNPLPLLRNMQHICCLPFNQSFPCPIFHIAFAIFSPRKVFLLPLQKIITCAAYLLIFHFLQLLFFVMHLPLFL